MNWPDIFASHSLGTTLTLAAMVGFYISSRTGAEAAVRLVGDRLLIRSLFHWVPVAAVSLAAACSGHFELAFGVILGTSIAALCMVVGISALGGQEVTLDRRAVYILPAALLLFLIGFNAKITPWSAGVLALQGGAIALGAITRSKAAPAKAVKARRSILAGPDLVLSVALSGLTAWAADRGSMHLVTEIRSLTPGLVGSLVLAPALMLPLIGTAQSLLGAGRDSDAASLAVPIALLNLCLLLPVCIALCFWGDSTKTSLFFPMLNWRIDCLILVIISAALVPAAFKNWRLGWIEGLVLIAAYALYLVVSLKAGVRMM